MELTFQSWSSSIQYLVCIGGGMLYQIVSIGHKGLLLNFFVKKGAVHYFLKHQRYHSGVFLFFLRVSYSHRHVNLRRMYYFLYIYDLLSKVSEVNILSIKEKKRLYHDTIPKMIFFFNSFIYTREYRN